MESDQATLLPTADLLPALVAIATAKLQAGSPDLRFTADASGTLRVSFLEPGADRRTTLLYSPVGARVG